MSKPFPPYISFFKQAAQREGREDIDVEYACWSPWTVYIYEDLTNTAICDIERARDLMGRLRVQNRAAELMIEEAERRLAEMEGKA